jgi:hypothetical protein
MTSNNKTFRALQCQAADELSQIMRRQLKFEALQLMSHSRVQKAPTGDDAVACFLAVNRLIKVAVQSPVTDVTVTLLVSVKALQVQCHSEA